MKRPPNILFLMTDQHRWDVLGFNGNPIVRTPTLDHLTQDAVVFDNAYTPSPVCVPGRQCMMSGQFPKTCGAEVYGDDLKPNSMTFARALAQQGYNTVCAGKLHHMGRDQMQGWTQRLGWHDMHTYDEYVEGANPEKFKALKPHLGYWSIQKEIERSGIGESPFTKNDAYTVQGALNFIEEYFNDPFYDRPRRDTPLLLKVSLQQPHYPFVTDKERFNYYLNRVLPYTNQSEGIHRALDDFCHNPQVSERDKQRAIAAYYGMVEQVDAHFDTILKSLDRVGENLDDWIVVFTTDHGDMLGEHNNWWKLKFYEGSVKVPLFIRYPKHFAPRRVSENVNLCDLFATFCELTDTPTPMGLDSRSLVNLLKGDANAWDDESISQVHRNYLMIKRGHLKYQWYGSAENEVLFDLEQDPNESINQIANTLYAEDVAAFRQRAKCLGYGN